MFGDVALIQTEVEPLIVADGVGRTVKVTGLAATEHPAEVAVIVYVVVLVLVVVLVSVEVGFCAVAELKPVEGDQV